MKFVKTKFFIITLIVAVTLVLVPAVLAAFGQVDILRSGLKTVAKPFEWCASSAASGVRGFVSVFSDYDELQRENEELREQLESIENERADNEVLRAENEWLREFLEVKTANADFELVDAAIISHEAGNFSTILTLNRGVVHGVKVNMPVITPDGVLGYVCEAGLDWCKVASIIESDSRAGAYTDRTHAIGTLEGDPALRAEGKCLISYEPDADIKAGDRVYTSGTGSIYPDGLLLGRIVSVSADESTRRLVAVVEPAVDFSALRELGSAMIILGYEGQSTGGKK